MFQHILYRAVIISFRPQKFFKIQRKHFIIGFIANTVAFNFPVIDPNHRATADHVESAIDFKEFQCSCNLRKFLQLVKKEQGLAFYKTFWRINPGNIFDNTFRFVSIRCNHFILWFFYKINTDHTFIVLLSKPPDGFGFSHLPRSFYNQRFPVRIAFPCTQKKIDFSF